VYFVIYIEFLSYCLFVSNSQVIGCEDRPPPKWPILCRVGR